MLVDCTVALPGVDSSVVKVTGVAAGVSNMGLCSSCWGLGCTGVVNSSRFFGTDRCELTADGSGDESTRKLKEPDLPVSGVCVPSTGAEILALTSTDEGFGVKHIDFALEEAVEGLIKNEEVTAESPSLRSGVFSEAAGSLGISNLTCGSTTPSFSIESVPVDPTESRVTGSEYRAVTLMTESPLGASALVSELLLGR